ncbi:MAG: hypothetical protein M0Z51_09035 [Propionibacterium sp.]|nr:hypothetical protein [Propionibacterium sp.]
MKSIRDSGAIDVTKLRRMVTDVALHRFDPNVVADNYIASGYADVIKVCKTDLQTAGLAPKGELQQLGQAANSTVTIG